MEPVKLDRIVVIGCGGAGKTFLSNRLADLIGAPLTHLDSIYYDAEWNPLDARDFAKVQRKLVSGDRWLIEGNYASTLPIRLGRADTVIFLDLHPLVCLAGIVQRRLRYRGGQHDNEGVYDRITPEFVRYILGFRRSMRPRVLALLRDHGANVLVVTLRTRKDVAQFVANLESVLA
jgi:adenylate kinase family enzyme